MYLNLSEFTRWIQFLKTLNSTHFDRTNSSVVIINSRYTIHTDNSYRQNNYCSVIELTKATFGLEMEMY